MPAKAPLPPPEDELEAAEAVVATVVLVDAVGLADKEVVVVVELAADKLVDTVVELAADDEEEAIGAVADFDVGVVMRQIPRAALPPHICNTCPRGSVRRKLGKGVGTQNRSGVPSWGFRSTQSGTTYPARRTPKPRCWS